MYARIIWLAATIALLAPAVVDAQDPARLVAGAGVGGTYYCIITRCGTGTTLIGVAAFGPRPLLLVEASVRWHECFDCKQFVIAEATLKLRRQGRVLTPFVGAGAGVSSDPDFMGTKAGVHAAIGTWVWLAQRWGVQMEVRGRAFENWDGVAEASILLAHRVPGWGR